jgi:hypothetical protein
MAYFSLYTPKKGHPMQTLANTFADRTFGYEQIAREGMVALYRQTHTASGVVRYETVRLHIQAAHTWPNGQTTPEKEAYPSSTAWGRRGWTFFTLAEAQAHMQTLLAQPTTEEDEADPAPDDGDAPVA